MELLPNIPLFLLFCTKSKTFGANSAGRWWLFFVPLQNSLFGSAHQTQYFVQHKNICGLCASAYLTYATNISSLRDNESKKRVSHETENVPPCKLGRKPITCICCSHQRRRVCHYCGDSVTPDAYQSSLRRRTQDMSRRGDFRKDGTRRGMCSLMSDDVEEFCTITSAHGLPRVAASTTRFNRGLWFIIFVMCLTAFIYQAYEIITKFNRKEKIVNVELKFENMPFPAVTICNLNPYKSSFIESAPEFQEMLSQMESAFDTSKGGVPTRVRRELINVTDVMTIMDAQCDCDGTTCIASHSGASECRCVHHSHDKSMWPCSIASEWETSRCHSCDTANRCVRQRTIEKSASPSICLCHQHNGICVKHLSNDKTSGVERIAKRDDGFRMVKMKPAFASCHCTEPYPNEPRCIAEALTAPGINDTRCVCFYNANGSPEDKRGNWLWPCYERSAWNLRMCGGCGNTLDTCDYASKSSSNTAAKPCLCTDTVKMCVKLPQENSLSDMDIIFALTNQTFDGELNLGELDDEMFDIVVNQSLVRAWEIPLIKPTPSVEEVSVKEALGFGGMTDQTAITAKAKENIMFAVNGMPQSRRIEIGTKKHEFINSCSFNSRGCNIENDFSMYLDPIYGSCFTFNGGASMENVSTTDRAGPAYGLRMQLSVNISEYHSTSESAGVRMAVHPANEPPFPDTSGFSAPTGAISSFGIHLKRVDRLPHPYGDCVVNGKTDDYIYQDKEYTVEGCHRSCMQRYIVEKCGCGDPRYPPVGASVNCKTDNATLRSCVDRESKFATINRGSMENCECSQSCKQFVYSVGYSSARWPTGIKQIRECYGKQADECLQYYRDEVLMIEIFYEALNYETLRETEAYGWPNLLSDFGGQLGLWMGVSVITILEVFIMIWGVLTVCCRRKRGTSDKHGDKRTNRANGEIYGHDDKQIGSPLTGFNRTSIGLRGRREREKRESFAQQSSNNNTEYERHPHPNDIDNQQRMQDNAYFLV